MVFQMCNYGAPDSDLTANYTFYRVDGGRRLFNRTDAQQFSDADLPPAGAWEIAGVRRRRPCRSSRSRRGGTSWKCRCATA